MNVTLFLDEQSVASHDRATFHLNQATKHPENPLLLPGEPHQWDSLQVSWPGTVLFSPSDGKFRCWYSGLDAVQYPGRFWQIGYAESDDGITWRKLALDQTPYLGRPSNCLRPDWGNVADEYEVVTASIVSTVFENPLADGDENRRFGCYASDTCYDAANRLWLRKSLAYSPDGIVWTRAGKAFECEIADRDSIYDICQIVHDPDEPDPKLRVKGYAQTHRVRAYDGRVSARHIGLVGGEDVSRVEAVEPIVLAPEEGIDEELHFASVRNIGGLYVMLFESDRFSTNPIRGDLRLAVSPDGRQFRRVHPLSTIVPRGAKGHWDENLLATTTDSFQMVGDEVYIYYFGCPNVYNSWPASYAVVPERRGSMFYPSYLGLATLPRDRFAFVSGPGTITTHPLDLGVDGVWLNAEGDDLTVTALDQHGQSVATARLGDDVQQSVYRRLVWDGDQPRGQHTLRIDLGEGSRIYSVQA